MFYRVYDKKRKCWVKDRICLSPNVGNLYYDLYVMKKGFFGLKKFKKVSDENYICYRDINLYDKKKRLIFEGDIVEASVGEDRIVTGVVTYAKEFAGYILLCYDTNEYFSLGSEVCEYIKIIGNVMDNKDLLPIDYIERE